MKNVSTVMAVKGTRKHEVLRFIAEEQMAVDFAAKIDVLYLEVSTSGVPINAFRRDLR